MSGVIAGLAISTVSAGASFAQAAKQNRLKRQAQSDAEQAMAAARGKLDVNFAEQMSIKKEAYDLERQAMLVQGAQLTQAGIESERGAAATAGRVFAQQQLGQQQIRSAMADEMTNIEAAVLEEESRLRDLGVGLDLEEVAGQQMMAADAQRAATASTQQGIQSAISGLQQGVEGIPLYMEKRADRLARKAAEAAAKKVQPTAPTKTFDPNAFNIFGIGQPSFKMDTDVSLFPMPGYTYDPITGKYKK
jgi:hypothetical protein